MIEIDYQLEVTLDAISKFATSIANLAEDYYSEWLRLFGWMSSNVKLSEVK